MTARKGSGQVVMGPNQPRPKPQDRIPSAPPRGVRSVTAAVPDPGFRDQLAEALAVLRLVASDLQSHGEEWPLARQFARRLDAVEAQVRAAANQRAAERRWASETAWIEGYEACRRGDQLFRNPYRAAALASPAPASRAEEA